MDNVLRFPETVVRDKSLGGLNVAGAVMPGCWEAVDILDCVRERCVFSLRLPGQRKGDVEGQSLT